MSDKPISHKVECGKLVETIFKINRDRDEYDRGDYHIDNHKNLNPLQLAKEQKEMINNYKKNLANADSIRASKAINVNEIMNSAQLNSEDRHCGMMDAQSLVINEYED